MIGLVILTVAGLFWLRTGSREPMEPYAIVFEKHSLLGLQADATVTMRGIPVGRIREIDVGDDPERVLVRIEVKPGTPVKTDTRAVLDRNLLTNLATIDLIGGTTEAPALHDANPERTKKGVPIIQEGSPHVDALRTKLPDILEKTDQALVRVSEIFSEENLASIERILASLDSVLGEVSDEEKGIGPLVSGMHALVADLRGVARRVDDTLAQISMDSKEPIDEMSDLLRELRGLVSTIETTTREVVLTQSSSLARLSEDIRRAALSLSRTMESFERPRTIFSGPAPAELGPGESE